MQNPTARLTIAIASALVFVVLPGAPGAQNTRQMQAAIPIPVTAPRFAMTAKPTTVEAGRTCEIAIELQDAKGRKMDAPASIDVVLTVTTLPTLFEAKQTTVAPPTSSAASLDNLRVTLASGQPVIQVRAQFPKGQGDVDLHLTSNRLGDVRVFIEAAGRPQVQPGSALITVARDLRQMRRQDVPEVRLIAWRPDPPDGVYLRFKDSGLLVTRQGLELVRPFHVGLERVQSGTVNPVFPPNGAPMKVNLSIVTGHGRFAPQLLEIPADSINSNATELRSSIGGTVEMLARSVLGGINEAHGSFTFEKGARATNLVVRALSESALANGLDPIAVEVSAVYRDAGAETVMKANDEGLPNREVTFRFTGGSARLEKGATSVVIPANSSSTTVNVFANLPSRALSIEAHSTNGLGEPITGAALAKFGLPWVQLLLAVVGGLLIPVIKRASLATILLSGVAGAVLYLVAFFGALATGQFNLGAVAVALTKLPTENVLAAFVVGVIGCLAIAPALGSKKKP